MLAVTVEDLCRQLQWLVVFRRVGKSEFIGQGIDEAGESTVCYLYLQRKYDICRIWI